MKKVGNLLIELLIYITLGVWVLLLLYQGTIQYYGQHKKVSTRSTTTTHFFSAFQQLMRDVHSFTTLEQLTPQFLWGKRNQQSVCWSINGDRLIRTEGQFDGKQWTKKTSSLACRGIKDASFCRVTSGIVVTFSINGTKLEQFIAIKEMT